ncbi:hypothetical protein ACFZCV_33575 [Streptomyces sp. NPDC007920]|uniref:hypothetical protein n=1 Tax=Streptomyces sp. NPDC007920 TaxID=3364794 RepID=UPI0036E9FC48
MTKGHARKDRARRTARRTGASYTSARVGTVHTHPAPVLPPVSGKPFGVPFTADMSDAAAAIGARLADCEPCLASAVDRMTWRYPLVPTALAASLPAELGEGFTPTTTAFCETIPRYAHEEAYLFVAYLEEDELHDLITDLIDVWAWAIPRLTQNAQGGQPLDSLIIDLTPPRPPFYVAAHTGFVPVPDGSFPALTINSPDLTGTIDDLAERCGFPRYTWNTLPGITPWLLQQHPKTHRPWGVRSWGKDMPRLTVGSPEHSADASNQWTQAVHRAGSVLVLGLWHREVASIRGSAEDHEIFAVRARVQPAEEDS